MSFEASSVELEIQTLLHAGQSNLITNDSVSSVITPRFHKDLVETRRSKASVEKGFQRQHSSDSESSQSSSDVSEQEAIAVNGADIGDLPTQYTVTGLQRNEIPVIGNLMFLYQINNVFCLILNGFGLIMISEVIF